MVVTPTLSLLAFRASGAQAYELQVASGGRWTSIYSTSGNNLQTTRYVGPAVSGSALKIRMSTVSFVRVIAFVLGGLPICAPAAPNTWQQWGTCVVSLRALHLVSIFFAARVSGMRSKLFACWRLRRGPSYKIASKLRTTRTQGTNFSCTPESMV